MPSDPIHSTMVALLCSLPENTNSIFGLQGMEIWTREQEAGWDTTAWIRLQLLYLAIFPISVEFPLVFRTDTEDILKVLLFQDIYGQNY